MINLIWALASWSLVFIFIPWKRIKQLLPVGLIAMILLFVVDQSLVELGYYHFIDPIIFIGNVPLFYLIAGAAGGIFMANWFPRTPLYKPIYISFMSLLFIIVEKFYLYFQAFEHGVKFDILLSFILDSAGLSFLAWLGMAVVGAETIYTGRKSRFSLLNNPMLKSKNYKRGNNDAK